MANPFGNMGNLGGMMKQAKKMYEDVQKVQQELDAERIEATSGGGVVKAVVTGSGDLLEVKIDPQAVDPDDVEMLEDLVTTAVREALAKAKELAAERMQEATGGLGIPGMF
ncbi:MAG: YbaB/EbfC family nucleoid-associated protein [Armatimonadetes bacterium]|nr:YbaB/EbfC family nucleoid-associated protein [Armatimonadota bacterium]